MSGRPLHVLQVSSSAQGGGAERVAYTLHHRLRARSQQSWMAVGLRNLDEPDIFEIPRTPGPGTQGGPSSVVRRAMRVARSPRAYLDRKRGLESFDFPGTRRLLDLSPSRPDVVHCHNLHGSYFDLRQLGPLSHEVPVVLTLHDEWSYTGHCAYTLGLENWRSGCFSCPDLGVYPPISRDTTHANWLTKRSIYRRSRLYVTTPSQWLMDRAQASILAEGAVAWRVIPNGVDRSTFKPGDRLAARRVLGLPEGSTVLLFTANRARTNPFKDYATVVAAARLVGEQFPEQRIVLVALGDGGRSESTGNVEIRPAGYEADPGRVATYYQAADLYLHAANADNLPTTIIEALASGLPVVATAVGGIPEMVHSLGGAPGAWAGETYDGDSATGVLVEAHDAGGMAAATVALLGDDRRRAALGANAVEDAAVRFDLNRQVDVTFDLYWQSLDDWRARAARTSNRRRSEDAAERQSG